MLGNRKHLIRQCLHRNISIFR